MPLDFKKFEVAKIFLEIAYKLKPHRLPMRNKFSTNLAG